MQTPIASVDARIAAIAARQHGIVTAAQLRAAGLTTSAISKRVRAHRLHRVHPGVYAVGHHPTNHRALVMAAVLSVGDEAAAAGLCAAELWDTSRFGRPHIEVVAPRAHRGLAGAVVHRSRCLPARHLTRRHGIPTTTPSRTILDLAEVLTAWQLAWVLHEAAFRRRLRLRELDRLVREHRTRHGCPVLVRALELHRAGSAGTRSMLEDRFLAAVLAAGLPEPEVNVMVAVRGDEYRVDFVWRDVSLCVEQDSPPHDRLAARRDDSERTRALRAAGYRVLRVHEDWIDAAIDQVRRQLAA